MDSTTKKKYIDKLNNKLYLNHLEGLGICEEINNILDDNNNKYISYELLQCLLMNYIEDHTENYKKFINIINELQEEYFNN